MNVGETKLPPAFVTNVAVQVSEGKASVVAVPVVPVIVYNIPLARVPAGLGVGVGPVTIALTVATVLPVESLIIILLTTGVGPPVV